MQENARIRGLYTVVKMIDNPVQSSPNRLVTKTMGKYGFINTDYDGPAPRHDEFWLVKIDREIKANSLQGCFVITPVKHIDRQDVSYLVKGVGQYNEYEESGIRYVLPVDDRDKYYVLPLEHRKHMKSVRSVIVVNFSLAGFSNSDRYFYYPGESGYKEERASLNLPTSPMSSSKYSKESESNPSRMTTPYDGEY